MMLSLNSNLRRYNAMSKPLEFDTFRLPKKGPMIPKLSAIGTIVLILSTVVAGCTTPPPLPTSFSGQCLLQPISAQGNVMLVNVHCEKGE